METKVILSEEDYRKCAQDALTKLQDYQRRKVTKWVEDIISGLPPRARTVLAEIMPIDLYIWAALVSPNVLRMLEDSLPEVQKVQ